MKKIISFLLSIVMIFSIVSMVDLSAYANESNTDNNDIDKMFNSYVNKADDFNFLEYVAQHYTSDKIKNIINFRTNEKTNTQNMVDYLNNNSLFQISYAEWEAATFITDPSEVVSKNLDKETYYETILLRIINSSVSSDNAIDWLNQGAIKNSVKILKNMTKVAETDYYACLADRHILISDLTETEINKINEFSKNYLNSQSYKVFGKDLDFISDVLSISKDIEQYSEKLASYCQLIELGDAVADFLNEIGKNTNDKYLKKAIDRIVPIIKDSYISMLNNAVSDGILNIGVTAMKKIVGDTWKKSLINLLNNGVLFNGTVIVNSAFLAIGVTKLIGNIAFSVDAKLDKYELMKALCSFEESMSETINNLLNDYQQNDNYSNLLLESVAIIYQAYIVDTELQTEAINLCKKDWIKFVSNKDLDELLEISKNNKATYQDEYNSITIKSGSCGENTYWVITDENELIIYGIGNTNDYTSTTMPWYEYLSNIQSICITSFINYIGSYLFFGLENLKSELVITNSVIVNSHNFDSLAIPIYIIGNLELCGNNSILSNNTITILEDVIMKSAGPPEDRTITINENSEMYVKGNFYSWSQHLPRRYTYVDIYGILRVDGNTTFEGSAILQMKSEESLLTSNGNFSYEWDTEIPTGIIEVKGNVNCKCKCSNNNLFIINGNKQQEVDSLTANNLIINNNSNGGVLIKNNITVNGYIDSPASNIIQGEKIFIKGGYIKGKYKGNITIIESNIISDTVVEGNLNIKDSYEGGILRILSNKKLVVTGNVLMESAWHPHDRIIQIDENSEMHVNGNFYSWSQHLPRRYTYVNIYGTLRVDGNTTFEGSAILQMKSEESLLTSNGNFSYEWDTEIPTGIIEVKGNVKSNTTFSGTNTLVLNGAGPQTIDCSNFSVIEVRNSNGVTFNKSINVSKLFNHNGNPFTLYNDGKGSLFVDYDNDGINDNLDPYPIQNHEFYEIERVNPTCTNDGYYIAHCDKCNQNKRVIIKKLGHTYVLSKHTDSTCNTSGYDEYKCTACGNTYRDEMAVLDGSALTASLEKAQTYLAKDYFTNESMAILQNVYDSHINDLDTSTTQMAVDNAATEINTAINNLVLGNYANGKTDDGFEWQWEKSTGILTVSGTGNMSNYGSSTMPWYDVIMYTTEIIVSDGITSIGKYAFYNATNVTQILLPNTLTEIGQRAFEHCTSVEEIVVPNTVVNLGYGAFANMTSLKKVTVPASTTYCSYCFDKDKAINEINITYGIDGVMPVANVTAEQMLLFTTKTGAFGPWKYVENAVVTIEDGVSKIGDKAFYYCSGIKCIEFPDTVQEIGTGNFVGADAATEITILNPNCTIQESSFTSSNTIIGYSNSTAKVFANNNSIPFKAIDEHTHTYGEWTYNGDAEYISSSNYKNGTQTRTCSVCGEEETVEAPNTALLRRRGNALALESSITLSTYITKDIVDYYDEVYAEFTRNGKTETVYASDKTFKSGSTVYNIFDYAGISPQAMGDDIEIKFYGFKNGVKYWGETYTYSVTTYVTSTLSKSDTSAKLKTMLVDLMYYGEACQIYQNYKTDSLMTNILTDEQKKLRSTGELNLTNIKDSSYATCKNRLVRFGTALRLNNAVELAIPLNMTNVTLEELSFKVKIGSRDLTYTYSDNPENFEKGKDGYWYFYFDGVYANQMSDEVFITAYRGDEQVSYTLKYSVESYAATVTDSKLKKVTDAMMRYGNSAKAYSG